MCIASMIKSYNYQHGTECGCPVARCEEWDSQIKYCFLLTSSVYTQLLLHEPEASILEGKSDNMVSKITFLKHL